MDRADKRNNPEYLLNNQTQHENDMECAFKWMAKKSKERILDQEMVSEKRKKLMIMWNRSILKEKLSKLRDGDAVRDLTTVCSIFMDDNIAEIVKLNLEPEVAAHFKTMAAMDCLTFQQYSSVITALHNMTQKYKELNPVK